jgi:prephenate dehydrogenase
MAAPDRATAIAGPPDLIVVAGPPAETVDILAELTTDGLVIDVCSVKAAPAGAGAHLARYVPTHPMAGREVAGPEAASAAMFEGATWVVCDGTASEDDVSAVAGIISTLGARPVHLSATDHDAAVAVVSHLPQVVAVALMLEAAASPDSLDLAAGSFRDLTRVAASDPLMWESVLNANSDEVAAATRALRRRLEDLEAAIVAGGGELRAVLGEARAHRERLGAPAVPVRIALADRPGELAKVGHALAESGVDVRDLQLRHAPYGGGGVLTIAVRSEEAGRLRSALLGEGLLLIE